MPASAAATSADTARRFFSERATVGIEWGVAATLIAYFAVFAVWPAVHPPIRTDFPNYYVAARAYREGLPLDRVYEWTWMQRQKLRLGIDQPVVGFAALTPFSALPLAPFAKLSPMAAKRAWIALDLIFLLATASMLTQITALGWRRVLLVLFLAARPLRSDVLFGQQYILVLLLMTAAAWLYLRGRDMASGGLLAVAGGLKMFPLCFAVYFVRKRNWRALAGIAAGAILIAAVSVWLFGFELNRAYITRALPFSLRGEANDPFSLGWNSATALMHRWFLFEPELNPHPVLHWPALYGIAQPFCEALLFFSLLWLIRGNSVSRARNAADFGAFTALLLVISPATGSYHLCVLALAIALCLDDCLLRRRYAVAAALLAAYGALSLPLPSAAGIARGWMSILAMPYLLIMLAIWVAIAAGLWSAARSDNRLGWSRDAVAIAAVALLAVAVGTALNARSLRGRFDDYAGRLPFAPGQFMETSPAVSASGVLFSAMTASGYRAAVVQGGPARYLPIRDEVLHLAATPSSETAYAEVSTAGVSNIVSLRVDGSTLTPVVRNAMQPAISPDGTRLIYVRADSGRGVLWMHSLARDEVDTRVSAADLDVLEANFAPDGSMVASARSASRDASLPEIFRISRDAAGEWRWIPVIAGPARWPAVSPDSRRLVFARLQSGAWNLWLATSDGAAPRRLTSALCNAMQPAWMADSRTVVFTTDCSRGFMLTTLSSLRAIP